MTTFHQVSESDLRQMAREASSMYFSQDTGLTDAVVKVASAFPHQLTSEHVRRVCEMTYHDAYERAFRDSPGPSRVVSFDPPEATKVAEAVRAVRIQSMQDKIAASAGGRGTTGHEKSASAIPMHRPPPIRNVFSDEMGKYADSSLPLRKMEVRGDLAKLAGDTREAEQVVRNEIGSTKAASEEAYVELGRQVRQEVINGHAPESVLLACVDFMKQAGAPDAITESVISDLAADMLRSGFQLDGKTASLEGVAPNKNHPLYVKAAKVANLKSQRLHWEFALDEVLRGRASVDRELGRALYQ